LSEKKGFTVFPSYYVNKCTLYAKKLKISTTLIKYDNINTKVYMYFTIKVNNKTTCYKYKNYTVNIYIYYIKVKYLKIL